MKIGDKVSTLELGKEVRGTITGKHGDADYYAVELETGEVIYRWADDLTVVTETYTYNGACAEIEVLFGHMKVEVMGTPSKRVVFFVDHKAVAQYKESTGSLAWYPYGKELKASVVTAMMNAVITYKGKQYRMIDARRDYSAGKIMVDVIGLHDTPDDDGQQPMYMAEWDIDDEFEMVDWSSPASVCENGFYNAEKRKGLYKSCW